MKTRILLGTVGLSFTTLVFSLWGTEYAHTQRAYFNYLSLVVLGVLLVSYALAFGKAQPKLRPRVAPFVVPPLFATLTFLSPLFGLPDIVLAVVSIAGGAGMLPLVVLWARSYDGLPAKTVALSVGFALILNHVFHLLLVLLPSTAYAISTSLLPPLSALVLLVVLKLDDRAGMQNGEGGRERSKPKRGPEQKPKRLGRFVAATMMANIALSFIYMLYRVPGMSESAVSSFEVPATLARIALLVAIVVVLTVVLKFRLINYYRCIVVFGIFGFLAFPLFGNGNFIPYVLTATSFTCLGIIMWVFPICYGARNRISSDYVIGLTYGPFVALWAITYFIAEYPLSRIDMSAEVLNIITLCGAGLVVLAYAVVFTERDLLQALASRDDLRGIDARKFVDDEQLRSVAGEYALTERECEVFAKLFAGKTRAQVREELCISEGTLNSHTREHLQENRSAHPAGACGPRQGEYRRLGKSPGHRALIKSYERSMAKNRNAL